MSQWVWLMNQCNVWHLTTTRKSWETAGQKRKTQVRRGDNRVFFLTSLTVSTLIVWDRPSVDSSGLCGEGCCLRDEGGETGDGWFSVEVQTYVSLDKHSYVGHSWTYVHLVTPDLSDPRRDKVKVQIPVKSIQGNSITPQKRLLCSL